jgi:hypothetical protein
MIPMRCGGHDLGNYIDRKQSVIQAGKQLLFPVVKTSMPKS